MPVEPHWERAELLDVYKVAVEEYRFQVQLNWSRTQYLFVLTAGILAVGTGLLDGEADRQPWLVGIIFGLGFFTAAHAIAVTASQHGYYRAARDRMLVIAGELGLPKPYHLTTTPGMTEKDEARRGLSKLGRVTWMHYGLFALLALLHAVAAGYVFLRA